MLHFAYSRGIRTKRTRFFGYHHLMSDDTNTVPQDGVASATKNRRRATAEAVTAPGAVNRGSALATLKYFEARKLNREFYNLPAPDFPSLKALLDSPLGLQIVVAGIRYLMPEGADPRRALQVFAEDLGRHLWRGGELNGSVLRKRLTEAIFGYAEVPRNLDPGRATVRRLQTAFDDARVRVESAMGALAKAKESSTGLSKSGSAQLAELLAAQQAVEAAAMALQDSEAEFRRADQALREAMQRAERARNEVLVAGHLGTAEARVSDARVELARAKVEKEFAEKALEAALKNGDIEQQKCQAAAVEAAKQRLEEAHAAREKSRAELQDLRFIIDRLGLTKPSGPKSGKAKKGGGANSSSAPAEPIRGQSANVRGEDTQAPATASGQLAAAPPQATATTDSNAAEQPMGKGKKGGQRQPQTRGEGHQVEPKEKTARDSSTTLELFPPPAPSIPERFRFPLCYFEDSKAACTALQNLGWSVEPDPRDSDCVLVWHQDPVMQGRWAVVDRQIVTPCNPSGTLAFAVEVREPVAAEYRTVVKSLGGQVEPTSELCVPGVYEHPLHRTLEGAIAIAEELMRRGVKLGRPGSTR